MTREGFGTKSPESGGAHASLLTGTSKRRELRGGHGRGLFLRGLLGQSPDLRVGPGLGGARELGPRRSGGLGGLRLLPYGPRHGLGPRSWLLASGPAA